VLKKLKIAGSDAVEHRADKLASSVQFDWASASFSHPVERDGYNVASQVGASRDFEDDTGAGRRSPPPLLRPPPLIASLDDFAVVRQAGLKRGRHYASPNALRLFAKLQDPNCTTKRLGGRPACTYL
jgi:hypothetical protein